MRKILFLTAIFIVLIGIGFYIRPSNTSTAISFTPIPPMPPTLDSARIERRIVPSGIHSKLQLLTLLSKRPDLREFYKNFNVDEARVITLDHDMWSYVSYRTRKGTIAWTTKPKLMRVGEKFLFDGTTYIRAECGNLVAFTPQFPVEPTDEPIDDVLLEPVIPVVPGSFAPPDAPVFPPVVPEPNGSVPTDTGFYPYYPVACCFVGTTRQPPTSVPEPSESFLLVTGLLVLALALIGVRQ